MNTRLAPSRSCVLQVQVQRGKSHLLMILSSSRISSALTVSVRSATLCQTISPPVCAIMSPTSPPAIGSMYGKPIIEPPDAKTTQVRGLAADETRLEHVAPSSGQQDMRLTNAYESDSRSPCICAMVPCIRDYGGTSSLFSSSESDLQIQMESETSFRRMLCKMICLPRPALT